MAYLNSTQVQVYPTAYRGSDSGGAFNPEASLLTENNISNLGYHVSDRNFVVSGDEHQLEFCIKGHFFKITSEESGSTFTEGFTKAVWANIKVMAQNPGAVLDPYSYPNYVLVSYGEETPTDSSAAPLAVNLDEGSVFTGLSLTETSEEGTDPSISSLLLLVNEGGSWSVPASSYLKFDPEEIKGGEEDGEEKGLNKYLDTEKITVDEITSHDPSGDGLRIASEITVPKDFSLITSTIVGNGSGSDKLTIDSNSKVTGNLTVSKELTVTRDANILKELHVNGNTTIQSNLNVNSNAVIEGDLTAQDIEAINVSASKNVYAGANIEAGYAMSAPNISAEELYTKELTTEDGLRVKRGTSIYFSADESSIWNRVPVYSYEVHIGDNDNITIKNLNGRLSIEALGGINIFGSTTSFSDKVEFDGVLECNDYIYQYTIQNAGTNISDYAVPNVGWVARNTARKLDTDGNTLRLLSGTGTVLSSVAARDLIKLIVDIVYPVGSIYITVGDEDPNTKWSGTTWTKLRGGYALWSASVAGDQGRYLDAMLPRMLGTVKTWGPGGSRWDWDGPIWGHWESTADPSTMKVGGCFEVDNVRGLNVDRNTAGEPIGSSYSLKFDSALNDSVYWGENPKVARPNAYTVWMWQRTN